MDEDGGVAEGVEEYWPKLEPVELAGDAELVPRACPAARASSIPACTH